MAFLIVYSAETELKYTNKFLNLKLFIVILNLLQHLCRKGDTEIILKQVQDKIWDDIQYKKL